MYLNWRKPTLRLLYGLRGMRSPWGPQMKIPYFLGERKVCLLTWLKRLPLLIESVLRDKRGRRFTKNVDEV